MIVEVLTGPQWLADHFDGRINSINTAKMEVRYINGTPVIGKQLLTDPTYQDDLDQEINGQKVRDYLTLINIDIPQE